MLKAGCVAATVGDSRNFDKSSVSPPMDGGASVLIFDHVVAAGQWPDRRAGRRDSASTFYAIARGVDLRIVASMGRPPHPECLSGLMVRKDLIDRGAINHIVSI